MTTSTDQRLKDTFADAMRRPERPAPSAAIVHGPLANRRPDKSLFILGISRIRPDPDQVRTRNKGVADEEVRELAESIKAVGLENPLTVRYLRDDDIYELIAGERRFTAAKLAGLEEVPVKLIEADEKAVRRLQLHENVHRANLTPIELGTALLKLLDDGETPDTLARLLCKSPAYVQKSLTVARQLSAPAKKIAEANPQKLSSLDLLYDIAQSPETEHPMLLQRILEEALTRDEVRNITAPLKHIAKLSKGKARGRRPRAKPIFRKFEVPCDATVTVVFRNRLGVASSDYRVALRQANEQLDEEDQP